MKHIKTILFFAILSCAVHVKGQVIILTGAEKSAVIDCPGEVKIIDANMDLNNAMIKSGEFFIAKEVKKIRIKGTVNITCKSIILEPAPDPIEIEFRDKKGNLQIEYSSEFKSVGRPLKLKATKKSKLNIIKI